MKDFIFEYWQYLFIPLVSGIIGWGTNVVALRMTFYPINFIGIKPWFGWQGIIPAKAGKMAGKAVDLLTSDLITIDSQFAKLNPKQVAAEMRSEVRQITIEIIDRIISIQLPHIWRVTPDLIKDRIYSDIAYNLPVAIELLFRDIKKNINSLFDLRKMVVETLTQNKRLMNRIFQQVGKKELRFIENSGFYFGLLFGIIQAIIWYFFHYWWILPLSGLIVGFATNWLALKLIFFPERPIKIGWLVVQGMFVKRQKEVADEYAQIVARHILTPQKIFDTILLGSSSDLLYDLIYTNITRIVEAAGERHKPLLELFSDNRIQAIKNLAALHFSFHLPVLLNKIYPSLKKSLDIEATLQKKMAELPPDKYQGFLRPVFQEDEIKLILVGALLGFIAGGLQVFVF